MKKYSRHDGELKGWVPRYPSAFFRLLVPNEELCISVLSNKIVSIPRQKHKLFHKYRVPRKGWDFESLSYPCLMIDP